MTRRLLVLSPAELTRDPRARRQSTLARTHGFEVVGVCGLVSGEPPAPLDGIDIVRVGPQGRVDAARDAEGLGRRSNPFVLEARGVYRILRLCVRSTRLARAALRAGPLEVVHANDFDTLPAAAFVARRRHARLVYDAHELYADFESNPPRVYRAFVRLAQAPLARRAAAVVTVSDALADALRRDLQLSRTPHVVLNAPDMPAALPPLAAHNGPLRVAYAGGFGSGRPLSDLLDAAAAAPSIRLRLRATHQSLESLGAELARRGLADRVEIAEVVAPDRIVEALADEEVGVVFDRPVTANARFALPNKIFEYMAAGLAVVGPRLPAIEKVIESSDAGLLVTPGDPAELAAALERLAADRPHVQRLRENARRAAVERFNADAQAEVLEAAWGLR